MRNWPGLGESLVVRDHFCRNTPRDFPIFKHMKQGDLYPDAVRIAAELYRKEVDSWDPKGEKPQPKPEDFIPPYPLGNFAERWQKLYFDRPSWTVTAHLSKDCYSHIHPDDSQARTVSVREAARLQSFPDSFDFVGSTGECFRQIGNAVPPLLGFHLAKNIRRLLERKASRRISRTWETLHVSSSLWEDPAVPAE
jgi:DNA (cytosine-5)-methyltransferase 1